MKTGLGLYRTYRLVFSYFYLFLFNIRKYLLGFDIANLFIQRVDKVSLQLILRRNGALIGNNCDIETGITFHNCKNYSHLIIGDNCHIGKNCFFDLKDKIIIKDNVVISMQCSFITHQDFGKSALGNKYPHSSASIVIERDCYIGVNSTILMNIKVGNSSLIAAGSLVNTDIDPNTMAAGVPAKPVKKIH